jgi:hypothetical protein
MSLSDLILKEELIIHDKLNDKLWDGNKLYADVNEALLKIADAFIKSLKIDQSLVKDIILTGSNANFNYIKDVSDIDIHIEIDISSFKCFDITEYFQAKKNLWNNQHDIIVKGYPVEVYAEPTGEHSVEGAGVFSLKYSKWLVKPKKFNGEVDQESIDKKVKSIENQIDAVVDSKVDDMKIIEKLKENIKKLRVTGIQKGGEFSTNNLVFKELRNSGYLEKLSEYYDNLNDYKLSLE